MFQQTYDHFNKHAALFISQYGFRKTKYLNKPVALELTDQVVNYLDSGYLRTSMF